jgi:hypothetical protein
MRTMLISLADFPEYVPFSVHIAPLLVNHSIRDAHVLDVGPMLTPELWALLEDLRAGEAEVPNTLPASLPLVFGDTPAPDPRLVELWTESVRPLLVYNAARRMLLWHGVHVTANGLETMSDVDNKPASDALRTQLRADLQSKCSAYGGMLVAALRQYNPTPTTGCHGRKRRPDVGGLKTYAI